MKYNINWKEKLSSRKFWSCLIGVASAFMILIGIDQITMEKTLVFLSAEATLIIYILSEASIDKARADSEAALEEDNDPIELIYPKGAEDNGDQAKSLK